MRTTCAFSTILAAVLPGQYLSGHLAWAVGAEQARSSPSLPPLELNRGLAFAEWTLCFAAHVLKHSRSAIQAGLHVRCPGLSVDCLLRLESRCIWPHHEAMRRGLVCACMGCYSAACHRAFETFSDAEGSQSAGQPIFPAGSTAKPVQPAVGGITGLCIARRWCGLI